MPAEPGGFERAQRYLQRPGRLAEEIACKRAYIRALEDEVGGAALGCRVTGGAPADRTAALAVKVSELREELERLQRQKDRAQAQIVRMVRRMPSARIGCLLEMRYLSQLSWDTIGGALSVSPRTAQRQLLRALRLVSCYLEAEDAAEGSGRGSRSL